MGSSLLIQSVSIFPGGRCFLALYPAQRICEACPKAKGADEGPLFVHLSRISGAPRNPDRDGRPCIRRRRSLNFRMTPLRNVTGASAFVEVGQGRLALEQ